MNKFLLKVLCPFFVLVSFFSCKEKSSTPALLIQAQELVDDNSVRALILLDSIPDYQSLDTYDYMQYILTRTEAKYNSNLSVATDTSIFEARDYFEEKRDVSKLTLAHFYSGGVYYQNDRIDKALISFMDAASYSDQSDDVLLNARSLNNIGYLYYEQDIMDSAIFYYKRALDSYDRIDGVDSLKMQTVYSMGSAFYHNYDLDSASYFYNEGLILANNTSNKKYQGIFTNHLGVVDRVKGNYSEAVEKLHSSLIELTNPIDSSRIYLNLAKLYNTTEQLDSARYYTDLLKERLPNITDKALVEGTYSSLAKYNQLFGNYIDALQYLDLESRMRDSISNTNQMEELLKANKDYSLAQKDKEIARFENQLFFWLVIIGVVIFALLLLSLCLLRVNKRYKKEVELKVQEYARMKEQLLAMDAESKEIENEIKSMLDEGHDE